MQIKEYQKGDETKIAQLFKTVFGKEMSIDYWKWRFADNPYSKIQIKLLCVSDQIIGHYAVSPQKINIHDTAYDAALSMTTMVHPDYNGKGYFTLLAKDLYDYYSSKNELKFVYGFPNINSHYGFVRKLNWKDVEIIPTMSISVDKLKRKSSNVIRIDNFDESYEKIINQFTASFEIKLNRTFQWLNWRYLQNPINKYVCLKADTLNQGFIIGKIFRFNDNVEFDVCELYCDDSEADVTNLLNGLLEYAGAEKIIKINLWMPLSDFRHTLLEKIGFLPEKPLTFLGCRSLSDEICVSPSNSFFYSMGDSDIY